jgi:hypothetical protein
MPGPLALLANPVVAAGALNLIDYAMKIAERYARGEITEEQALEAFRASAQAVDAAFAGWHAAAQPGES